MEASVIENKVANSGLYNLDLSHFKPKTPLISLDIAPWLWEGIALKESLFKEYLQTHDWDQYQNQLVALHCSADAIIPNWAFMLVVVKLNHIAAGVWLGTAKDGIIHHYLKAINDFDTTELSNQRVLIKGCGDTPPEAFIAITEKLIPVVQSLMFGEACSNVPLYKRKQNAV
jgi:hypothetical protein